MFTFKCPKSKPKPTILSNEFLVCILSHSYEWTSSNLLWLLWFLMVKHKYFTNFEWLCLQFDTLFSLLDYDYIQFATTPTIHQCIHHVLHVNMIMFYLVWFGEWGHLVLPFILRRFGMLAKKSTWQKGWCIGSLSSWKLFNYLSKCDLRRLKKTNRFIDLCLMKIYVLRMTTHCFNILFNVFVKHLNTFMCCPM